MPFTGVVLNKKSYTKKSSACNIMAEKERPALTKAGSRSSSAGS